MKKISEQTVRAREMRGLRAFTLVMAMSVVIIAVATRTASAQTSSPQILSMQNFTTDIRPVMTTSAQTSSQMGQTPPLQTSSPQILATDGQAALAGRFRQTFAQMRPLGLTTENVRVNLNMGVKSGSASLIDADASINENRQSIVRTRRLQEIAHDVHQDVAWRHRANVYMRLTLYYNQKTPAASL